MRKSILGMYVNVTSSAQAVSQVNNWVNQRGGRYVCVANVHMCMESFDDNCFRIIVNNADLVVPDGKPLVWMQKLLRARNAQQVRGMDIMLSLCEYAEKTEVSIGFYGGTTRLLEELKSILNVRFPCLQLVCAIAPPFRDLSSKENNEYITAINNSGVNILFVGLGCPKQERWMAENKLNLNCVMLGVGAAFDFIAGNKKHAPKWMQYMGLEWFFRLLSEPERLWKRYLKHNPRFVYYSILQLLGEISRKK